MKKKPALLTIGRIAYLLGVPVHRVRFVLETRPDIEPSAIAGRTRLFDNRALARIRYEIAVIDARRYGQIVDVVDDAHTLGFSIEPASDLDGQHDEDGSGEVPQ